MAESSRSVPDTPEERQAAVTVQSAKGVLKEIGELSRILSLGSSAMDARIAAKRELFEASERMCNLMSLAIHQVDHNLSGTIQDKLANDLAQLRDRLLSMGTDLMVEKLRKIGDRVETVLREGNYPLGLAGKLELLFGGLLSNLTMLGGLERLPEDDRGIIERTQVRLKQLSEIEHGLGIMVEMEKPRVSQQPISPANPLKAAVS